jgi:hypothetical protein
VGFFLCVVVVVLVLPALLVELLVLEVLDSLLPHPASAVATTTASIARSSRRLLIRCNPFCRSEL